MDQHNGAELEQCGKTRNCSQTSSRSMQTPVLLKNFEDRSVHAQLAISARCLENPCLIIFSASGTSGTRGIYGRQVVEAQAHQVFIKPSGSGRTSGP